MISQGKCTDFIFGSIIGGSPSNSTKGDTKDCSSRRDEPYLIFRQQLYLYTIGLFLYCKRMLLIMYLYHSLPIVHITDLCFAHEQSQAGRPAGTAKKTRQINY